MTRDEIGRLAKQAGITRFGIGFNKFEDQLERFAALVAADEREACAKWLEDGIYLDRKKETGVHKYTMDLLADLANGIRARGNDD